MNMVSNNKGYHIVAQDENIEAETDGKVKVQVRHYDYPSGHEYDVMILEGRTHWYRETFGSKDEAMSHYHSEKFSRHVEYVREKHSQ